MRKTTILSATAALACCGFSNACAQIQIMSGQATANPRLVATQTDVTDGTSPITAAQEVIPNPFDFFASEDPSSIPSIPEHNAPDTSISRSRPTEPTVAPVIVAEVDESPSDADAKSLPVGRRHRQQSMTETILDHGTVSAIPHTGMAPVCWSAPDQTPNPIANVLLRQDCNQQALWDGYSAQRAAECAQMWQHIAGKQRCAHGHNCPCANGTAACAPCNAPVRNRYTQHLHAPSAAQACDTQAAVVEVPLTPTTSCSTSTPSTENTRSSLESIAPPMEAAANVANLPFSFNR